MQMLKMDDCTSSESDPNRDSQSDSSSPDKSHLLKSETVDSLVKPSKPSVSWDDASDRAPELATTSNQTSSSYTNSQKADEADGILDKHNESDNNSLHLFTIRVIFFDGSMIPCGNFSPVDIRDLIIANCLQAQRIENMSLIDALAMDNGYIIGDSVLVINWPSEESVVKFSNPSERIFFPGNIYWNHWKQFYPDFECLSRNNNIKMVDSHGSNNDLAHSSTSSSQTRSEMQLNMFRRRILQSPSTMQPYTSREMKENISYLKSEYKIRDYRDEVSLKNFLRFLLETFSQEIKSRVMNMQQRSPGMHHSSGDGGHHSYESYHVRQV